MRAYAPVGTHVAIALAGAIAVPLAVLSPGIVRLAASIVAAAGAELPVVRADHERVRMILPDGTYPRAHISYGKDQARLAATELEWAR